MFAPESMSCGRGDIGISEGAILAGAREKMEPWPIV